MENLQVDKDWVQTSGKVFWGEIAPYDHVVQIYENDQVFLDLLCDFVEGGIRAGDCVVVIATAAHLEALNERLKDAGFNTPDLTNKKLFIPVDAEDALSKFMVNDWPDENLFMQWVTDVISSAKSRSQQVRAFGEMVAILWAKGHVGATVRLEHLWNKFCQMETFCLFCAYPQSGFTQDASQSVRHICGAHSKMLTISKDEVGKSEIFYKIV